MAEPRPILPLANEETARLKWFEAFMRGRVELEQKTYAGGNIVHERGIDCPESISSLQELLKGAPLLPERKLLWHCALEKLLDGTREELDARIEELEILKDQMQAMGNSIVKAEMSIPNLGIEFDKLESTENVNSARAATAISYKNWLDIESVEISVQKGLSDLFSSGRAKKKKLEYQKYMKSEKSEEAFDEYYRRDLAYRRIVHQQRKSQEQFLNSIPDRIQEHGTQYWTAVRDVGMVMESFANYIRNISSTCNSSGSTIWASAKNIKSLVDANCHTEAIEVAYHQSPMRFSPIYYRNPGSKSRPPSGQAILFGCPLELRTVGELKKIPPILEYLLDLVHDWHVPYPTDYTSMERWSLANEIEQAWTGVEESDRAMVSQLSKGYQRFLIKQYFLALPKPVLSEDDIRAVRDSQASSPILTWDTWSEDSIKKAVVVALTPWLVGDPRYREDIACALAQTWDFSGAWRIPDILSAYSNFLRGPVGNV